ncbi:MAG: DUF5050 domain-containing protein [Chloroflexota bacterium]
MFSLIRKSTVKSTVSRALGVIAVLMLISSLLPMASAPPVMGQTVAVTTGTATNVTANSATLNGTLTEYPTGAPQVACSFEWGTTTSYGQPTMPSMLTAAGPFSFDLPTMLNASTLYHFRAKVEAGPAGTVFGQDATFTTLSGGGTGAPTVQTLTPDNVLQTSATFRGNLTSMGSATSADCSFNWGATTSYGNTTSPATNLSAPGPFTSNVTSLTAGATYHYQAKADGGAAGIGLGNDTEFSTPIGASLIVNTPNGGENWTVGATPNITWNGSGFTGNVRIDLSRDNGTSWAILFPDTPNDGTEAWTVTGPATGQALVKISSLDQPSIWDASDNPFTISDTSGAPTVTTLAPDNVLQNSATLRGNLTSLGGTTPPVQGFFEWGTTTSYGTTTPNQALNAPNLFTQNITGLTAGTNYNYRAAVNGGAAGTGYGQNQPFSTPVGASLIINSPNGGEYWTVGATPNITWNGSGFTGNVKIELSRDNGNNWETLFADTPNDGSQGWTVTTPTTGQARVRISSLATPSINDTSDNVFTIGSGTAQNFTLTVIKAGTGTGDVTSNPAGIGGTTLTAQFPAGTQVNLNAVPDSGSIFAGWSGAIVANFPNIVVIMDGDKTCTVTFNQQQAGSFVLNVSIAGTGQGFIYSDPAGIGMGSMTAQFPAGTVVTLNASAAAGSTFAGWSGAVTGTTPSIQVTMDANKNVTATFNSQSTGSFSLQVNNAGTGMGTVTSNPPGINTPYQNMAQFPVGTVVTLNAVPSPGSTFVDWTGAVTSNQPQIQVTMDSNKFITASFNQQTAANYTLTIIKIGAGTGDVVSTPAGIGGATLTAQFPAGTNVSLQANPDTGSAFGGWSGDVYGQQNPIVVMMNSNKYVTAMFMTAGAMPQVTTNPASNITNNGARLNGTVTSFGSATSILGFFEAGATTTYGNSTPPITLMNTGPYFFDVFGLPAGTTIHYRAVVDGGPAGMGFGNDQTFNTTGTQILYTLTVVITPTGGGNVTSTPAGISGATLTAQFPAGAIVNLAATPATGYNFLNWSGDATGFTANTSVTMNSNKTVTANFGQQASSYTLNIILNPATGGFVTSNPAGISLGTQTATFAAGTVVTLNATPLQGYNFEKWTGDIFGTTLMVQVTMNSNKTITANFVEQAANYTLTVIMNPPNGGNVVSNPPGIGMGNWTASFPAGTIVNLNAGPAPGYTFQNWTGDASGTSGFVQVTMNANRTVTANYTQQAASYTLNVNRIPLQGGTVVSNPPGIDAQNMAANFTAGTVVTLTATPATGYSFVGWTGDAQGTGTVVQVTMNSFKNVSANFVQSAANYTLNVTMVPPEGGNVTSNPPGINAPGQLSASFAAGTSVTLTATASTGYVFTGWTGDATGLSAAVVVMNTNRNVTANFAQSGGAPAVTTGQATGIGWNTATLNGNLNYLGGAASVDVFFQYGPTMAYSVDTPREPRTATGPFVFSLTGLTPGSFYNYRAAADGGASGTGYGANMSFMTNPAPPSPFTFQTRPASNVGATTATLRGDLTSMGGQQAVDLYFDYGTTSFYGLMTEFVTRTATGPFEINVTGLSPNTTYHYRLKARASGGPWVYDPNDFDTVFMTIMGGNPPAVTTNAATAITNNSATLNGNLTSKGGAVTVQAFFRWGIGPQYGMNTPPQAMSATGPFSFIIQGLNPGMAYNFQAVGDGGVFGTGYGEDQMFVVGGATQPVVVTNPPDQVTGNSARLNGNLISLGAAPALGVFFNWGTNIWYGNMTPAETKNAPGPFNFVLNGLQPNQMYYYQAVADGQAAGIAFGMDMMFTTEQGAKPGKIVFVSDRDGNTEIYLLDTAAGTVTRLTNNAGADLYPTWKLDGTRIAWASVGDGESDQEIWTMNPDGSGKTRLTNTLTGNDYAPSWSPDGTKIAFTSNRDGGAGQVYVMNADGTNPVRLTTGDNAVFNGFPDWSPDGTRIVFSSGATAEASRQIYVMNADGSNRQRLTENTSSDDHPQWSPDGTKIVFQSNRSGNWEIWSMTATGADQNRIIEHSATDEWPSWAPDSQAVFFDSNRATGYQLFVKTPNGEIKQITNPPPSPVQNNTDPELWATMGPPQAAPMMGTMFPMNITHNSADLHGELFSLGSASSVIVTFEWGTTGNFNNNTPPETLTNPRHVSAPITGLTPQTQYNFKTKGDGGAAGIGYGPTQFFITNPPPMGVGAGIAFVSQRDGGNNEIWSMNPDGTNPTRLTNNLSSDVSPAYTPDASRIAFSSNRDSSFLQIYVMNPDGSNVQRLTTSSDDDTWPAWSYDRNKIAFTSHRDGNHEIYSMNADGSNVTRLTNNQANDFWPSWAPSNQQIVFTSSRDGNNEIYVMNADGTNPTRLTNNPANDDFPRFSPDGRRIVFSSDRDGTRHIYVMNADGSGQTRLTNDTRIDEYPAWSPEGSRIVFTRYETGSNSEIWVMNADGSNQQRLTNVPTHDYAPTWAAPGPRQEPPQVVTIGATDITPNSAMLHGGLTFMGSAPQVDTWFEWGTQSATVLNNTPRQMLFWPDKFEFTIGGLMTDTDYRFRSMGDGGFAGMAFGPFMNFRTVAVVNVEVTTMMASGIQSTGATLNGMLTRMGYFTSVNVSFEYGTTVTYGTTTTPQALTAPGFFSANLTGLTEQTAYHYRAKGEAGAGGAVFGQNFTFTTGGAPVFLTVSSGPPTNVTYDSATLNGSLGTMGGAMSVQVSFEYGATTSYGTTTTPQSKTAVGFFNANITGLTPGSTVHYRAKADAGSGNVAYGDDQTITVPQAPQASITLTYPDGGEDWPVGATKTIFWQTSNVSGSANIKIELSRDGGSTYTEIVASTVNDGNHDWLVAGDTSAQARIRVSVIGQTGVQDASTANFTISSAGTPPAVTTNAATNAASVSATLNGNLTSLGSSGTVTVKFQYGTTTSYGTSTTPQSMTATGVFSANVTGLTAGTTYNFRAYAEAGGMVATGENKTFTTQNGLSVTTSAASAVTNITAALNGSLGALGGFSSVNVSFEYGTSTSYGSTTTAQAKTSTGGFTADLTGLTASTTYNFRAKADAGSGNVAYGANMTFTTFATSPARVEVNGGNQVNIGPNAAANNLPIAIKNIPDLGQNNGVAGFTFTITWNKNVVRVDSITAASVSGWTVTTGTPNNTTGSVTLAGFTGSSYLTTDTTVATLNVTGIGSPGATTTLAVTITSLGDANGDDITATAVNAPVQIVTLPPSVTTGTATNITNTSATLGGELTSLGTATSATVSFEYGTTTSYGTTTTAQTKTATGAFTANLTGLTAGATYHFRAKGDGGTHGIGTGDDATFQTLPPARIDVNNGNAIALSPDASQSNIPISIKNIPNLGTGNGVGAFTFNLSWDKDVIRVDSLTAASVTGWSISAGTPNNTNGTVTIAGFASGTEYMTANTVIGNLAITALGSSGTSTTLSISVTSLGDKDGNPVPSATYGAQVSIVSMVAETALSQGVETGNVAVVNVKINRGKNPGSDTQVDIPGGVASFSATASSSAPSTGALGAFAGMELVGIVEAAPYLNPTINTTTGVFGVASVASPEQPNNSTVAKLKIKLTGDKNTAYTFNVSFSQIIAVEGGANIPEDSAKTMTFKRGDAQANGTVNIFDAMYIAQMIVGNRPITELNAVNAACVKHDTNGDKIDIFDAMFIAQMIVGNRNASYETVTP